MDEEKKTERKRKKFAARLKSSKGITCTEVHGPNIVLCNGGQATGLEKVYLFSLIKEHGLSITLPKYIAEKGESHSFLVFDTKEDALLFYNTFNGKAKADNKGTPLYLNFVETVPNTEIICTHENPKGLLLLNDFITQEEEKAFIKLFDWNPESNNLKNRLVKHYGYEFRYGSNDVDLNSPLIDKIPKECNILWKRLEEKGFNVGVPDQLTVNKYSPGQGIPSHVDKHSPFGGTILSLSLGSDVVMDWKHHSGKYVPTLVQARSLLVMQDEARYDWQHGIQPRTWDPVIENRLENTHKIKVITSDTTLREMRISLTFRWTRSGPCECEYKTLCDSVEKVSADNLEDELASNLEELHVHQARRLQAVSTIHRLLRQGGRALITVWAKDQTKSNYLLKSKQDQVDETQETQITVGGVNLPVHENRTQFKHQDLLVPWKLKKVSENKVSNNAENTLLRYYHVFEEGELDELCKEANLIIEDSFYEEGNWCVVCKKK
ncbi:hypothetical protein HF086_011330 [Spodoptera exigua]|uniref:Fe2OG dioxygenase domain-containing protein n=1 Tax=Spodoptera exigua TaxID=7107 RepID=A0A922M2F8_SPOEX|nr:hypothetical protein HF086_011330 [Spodoptera exigua]